MYPASAGIRIPNGAPDFAGSPDTVSNLWSGGNVFSGTTWPSPACCATLICCDRMETAAKTTRINSIEVRQAIIDVLLPRKGSTSTERNGLEGDRAIAASTL